MIYFLWIRGFIPNSVIEKDPLLVKTINDVSNKDYGRARHDLIVEMSIPHLVEQSGKNESWDCMGDLKDSRPFPCLFKSNGPIHLTWGDCTKMGEKCPFHDFYQFKNRSKVRTSQPRMIPLLMDPRKTITQLVLREFGVGLIPCQREFCKNDGFEPDIVYEYNEFRPCPEKGMRQTDNGSSYSICPWVITFHGSFPEYNTLNDIPQTFLFPPETLYSLASVILYSGRGGHYIGVSLDVKNPRGVHVIYDGMLGTAKRVQAIRLDDPKYAPDIYDIVELWYVKIGRSPVSSGTGTSKIPSTPSPPMITASVKPGGIPNFGNTCYFNTLVQIVFWLVPIRKRLIDYKLSKEDLDKMPTVVSQEFEMDSSQLYEGLKLLKKVLASLKIALTRKRTILKSQMKSLLESLGLSMDENQCVNELWIQLFHLYFEYIGFDHLYKVQITTHNREVLDQNKAGKPHEIKNTREEPLLIIDKSDLAK